jgi:hypothetical protein
MTYKTGFGLDDRIYCTLYIHTTREYRQYSAIAGLHNFQFTVTHALVSSVITSRILARIYHGLTVTSNHTWSLLFTAEFPSCHFSATAGSRRLDSPLSTTVLYSVASSQRQSHIATDGQTDHAENTTSILKEACLLIRYLAIDVLLLSSLAPKGMCLPSRCLAMGLQVII